jgi:hypothetical protein
VIVLFIKSFQSNKFGFLAKSSFLTVELSLTSDGVISLLKIYLDAPE